MIYHSLHAALMQRDRLRDDGYEAYCYETGGGTYRVAYIGGVRT